MQKRSRRYEVASGMLSAGLAAGAAAQLRQLVQELQPSDAPRRKRWTMAERDARALLARALYESGELAASERELRLVLKHNADDAFAAMLLARILRRRGHYAEAAEWLARLDQLGHDTWTADVA